MPFIIIFFTLWLSTNRSSPLLNCEHPRAGTVSCLFWHCTLNLVPHLVPRGTGCLGKGAWTCGQLYLSWNPSRLLCWLVRGQETSLWVKSSSLTIFVSNIVIGIQPHPFIYILSYNVRVDQLQPLRSCAKPNLVNIWQFTEKVW